MQVHNYSSGRDDTTTMSAQKHSQMLVIKNNLTNRLHFS